MSPFSFSLPRFSVPPSICLCVCLQPRGHEKMQNRLPEIPSLFLERRKRLVSRTLAPSLCCDKTRPWKKNIDVENIECGEGSILGKMSRHRARSHRGLSWSSCNISLLLLPALKITDMVVGCPRSGSISKRRRKKTGRHDKILMSCGGHER